MSTKYADFLESFARRTLDTAEAMHASDIPMTAQNETTVMLTGISLQLNHLCESAERIANSADKVFTVVDKAATSITASVEGIRQEAVPVLTAMARMMGLPF
jgi:hypothetical protein